MDARNHDIIIVGAGTAGCVLANRLSEDPNISVLVIEAGENRNADEKVYTPALSRSLQDDPKYDWQYVPEPDDGVNGRSIKQLRGKLFGGTSAINSLALIYPSQAGIDAWEQLGNPGWSWHDTKKYFRKFQTVSQTSAEVRADLGASSGVETSGPIQAAYPSVVLPFQKAWVETMRSLGAESRVDPLDGQALGGYISTCHVDEQRRERSHAGNAYLEPALQRKNMSVISGAMVSRIAFEKDKEGLPVATGVEYVDRGGESKTVRAKNVILATGVFGSAQLLELSGIGDARSLQRLDIPVVYDNPNVGENLQDHLKAGISFEVADGVELAGSQMSWDEARERYNTNRSGPWANMGCYTFGHLPLQSLQTEEDLELSVTDKQQSNGSLKQLRHAFVQSAIRSPNEATSTVYLSRMTPYHVPSNSPLVGKQWLTLVSMLAYPASAGSVHITSSDPFSKPRIDFQYYSEPVDLEVHARHVRSLARIASTPLLSAFIKQDGARLPADYNVDTLDGAKAILRQFSGTNYHPCGTCAMAPQDRGGVVDERLRVHGVKGLRVVDAAIMPIIPRGNIITTVYALAEKAADLISQDLNIKRTT